MVRLSPLTVILDDQAARRAGWDVLDLARAVLDGGATFLQIRAKDRSSSWLLTAAERLVALAVPCDATVIVNDRADIARLAEASGVHVGQDDLPPAAVRRLVGPTRLIGRSTHSLDQIDAALQEPIDYVAVGPVFATTSKDTGYDAVGPALVTAAAARARTRGLPVVAIGGITIDRAGDVLRAGASSVAVISDLLTTGDPRARTREYLQKLRGIGGV